MQLNIRGKLFWISMALILLMGLTSGLYLQHNLRDWLVHRIQSELLRQAHGARELVVSASPGATVADIDPMADRLAEAFESRVTVLAPGGAVVGDSDLSLEEIATIDNHGGRPEVRAALDRGHGQSQRYSTTLDTYMQYVAVPYQHPRGRGVVRVARPLVEVDAAVGRLRTLLMVAGLLGLVLAVIMSGVASHLMSRTLRHLAVSARALSRGEPGRGEPGSDSEQRARIDVTSSDEIGKLAGSLNRMADDIETTVATLASERARFEAVLESMSEGVIELDDQRRIRLMNAAALELLRLDEVPRGEPLIEHLRAPAVHELLAEPVETQTCEFTLPGPDARQVLVRVSPEHDNTGCVIVMHDVTDLRRLKTMRRDFVANVSHELRTPVSIIRANVETLLDGAMDDPVHSKRLLDALHRNAERLSNLISDLLDLSRLEAGGYVLEREAVDVAEAVQAAIASVERVGERGGERAGQAKGIAVKNAVAPGLRVKADAKALDQILVNYLDNAIKYTPEGGAVEVRARAEDGGVRIEVADNGPGIPPQLCDRVFERFYRVDPGRSRDMGGTGLGLSIVKHLVDAMDGAAGVEPAEPRGACFWVRLPPL